MAKLFLEFKRGMDCKARVLFNRNTRNAFDSGQGQNTVHTSAIYPITSNLFMIPKKSISLAVLLVLPLFHVFAEQSVNLLPEGSFSSPDNVVAAPKKQDGSWTFSPGDYANHGITYTLEEEEGRNFLSITTTTAEAASAWVDTTLMLPDPKPVQVRVSFRVRTKDLALADPSGPEWLSAQVQVANVNDAGDQQSNAIVYRVKASSPEWSEVEQVVPVSPEATKLAIQAGIWGHTGTIDIADFKVVPE